jgi:hypothetical protein
MPVIYKRVHFVKRVLIFFEYFLFKKLIFYLFFNLKTDLIQFLMRFLSNIGLQRDFELFFLNTHELEFQIENYKHLY